MINVSHEIVLSKRDLGEAVEGRTQLRRPTVGEIPVLTKTAGLAGASSGAHGGAIQFGSVFYVEIQDGDVQIIITATPLIKLGTKELVTGESAHVLGSVGIATAN